MKSELEVKTTIIVRFWNDKDIPTKHFSVLESAGLERALKMAQEGFTSGELHETVSGIDYDGWFELTTEIV